MTSIRLDYNQTGGRNQRGALQLLDTENNRRILSQQPSNGIFANQYTIAQIINKLTNYDLVLPENYSSLRPMKGGWCRLLKRVGNGYEFRTGGFVIANDTQDRFITFRNAQLNFTFAMTYDECIIFRHNPNKLNFTDEAQAFVNNLMNFNLNPNADFLVALSITTGEVFWTENRHGRFNRLINLITNQTGSRPFTRQTLNNNLNNNRNIFSGFVLGFLFQDDLDNLIILRDGNRIIDLEAEDNLRRFLQNLIN